jgi:uncharacterized protein YyaL (SSP411 family)
MVMANRLAAETSPYLLQHAHNPVDWYPWGPEALERARRENRPILLSIGYSACHWCHVMERESFENPDIARLMNDNFVNIKVDREERPDLDSIYMTAVQGMTGQGGWPMTVFLTPDGAPFYGGTYFPPEDRGGMPGFPRLLLSVAEAYRTKLDEVQQSAEQIRQFLQRQTGGQQERGVLRTEILDNAFNALRNQFDDRHGGFGGAPKFPQPMVLEFLLRTHSRTADPRALSMAELTLEKMARGGMYDQLGGGFHRYSVDNVWLVPHFEKMLYDNSQLGLGYLHAFQLTGNSFYRRICEETLDYVLREMTSPEGGFYSTQDADSEGEEGKFFVWTAGEIETALDQEDPRLFMAYYGVRPGGNFEGKSILFVPNSAEVMAEQNGVSTESLQEAIDRGRRKLFELRERRVKPGRDDKILTAWNGLMLRALAEAAAVLQRGNYRRAAESNANFVLTSLKDGQRLLRTYKDGQAKLNAYLEDYSFLADGLLALYESTLEARWYREARALVDTTLEQFWDEEQQAFFDTGRDHEQLVARPRDLFDNATPSGTSVAVDVLLRMAVLSGEQRYRRVAESVLRPMTEMMARAPNGFGRLLSALDLALAPSQEIAIIGDPSGPDTQALLGVVREDYRPNTVLALASGPDDSLAAELPLLSDRPRRDALATAYVCRNYACEAPTTDSEELRRQLASAHP